MTTNQLLEAVIEALLLIVNAVERYIGRTPTTSELRKAGKRVLRA